MSNQPSGTPMRTRQGIQSVEQGAKLLNVFATAGGPLSLRQLAADAGMSASKAHRYLVSLLRCGLAHQDPVSGHYGLGEMALKLGLAALGNADAVRFANEAIIELNQRLDVMVALSVWGSRGTTVIGLHNRSEIVMANLAVGSVLPLLRSASGKVFLAYLPSAVTKHLVKRELQEKVANTPPLKFTTPTEVNALISRVRRSRIGITDGDLVPGRKAIAAPIFDHQGVVVCVAAMIGVPSPSERYIQALAESAAQVSKRLGFFETHTPFVERKDHSTFFAPVPKIDGARPLAGARIRGIQTKEKPSRLGRRPAQA